MPNMGAPLGLFFRGFGQKPDYSTPGYGGPIGGAQPAMPQLPEDKGFFSRGGMGVQLLGSIGDAVSSAYGGGTPYATAQNQFRQRQQQLQDYRMKQADEMAQWTAQQEWERAHPKPVAPHYWETNDGSLGIVGPDSKPQILYQDPTPKVNWITADNGDGTKSVIPVGPNGPLTGQQPSRPAIGTVMKDPRKGGSGSGQTGFRSSGGF
ncbi:hypothetical protein [uncultured Sphingomonas sp.]|uniref:hypothetical protein n=1 Tax=uncultured Sphingomonas sp. TaxID=158754 RepID=UPI00374A6C2D